MMAIVTLNFTGTETSGSYSYDDALVALVLPNPAHQAYSNTRTFYSPLDSWILNFNGVTITEADEIDSRFDLGDDYVSLESTPWDYASVAITLAPNTFMNSVLVKAITFTLLDDPATALTDETLVSPNWSGFVTLTTINLNLENEILTENVIIT